MLDHRRPVWIECALAAGMLCAYLACEEEAARPDAAGDCDENCAGAGSTAFNPGVDAVAAGGSAGAGGGGNAGSAGSAAILTGSIQAVTEQDLSSDPDLGGTVKVKAAGTSGAQVTVDSAPDGSFRLAGVARSTELWVGVGPFSNDAASTFTDTLQLVNSTVAAPVQLLVMRRSVLNDIAMTGFLSNPLEVDTTRAHVILRFVNQQREGIEGVSLMSPDPARTSVAYDFGEIFSDQATETSTRGMLTLMNLATNPYPGTATTITAQVHGTPRNVDVHTASGAVTLVTTVVP